MTKAIEQEIRENWFKDHVANYTDLGQIKILDWAKPGTIRYRVRYVFDGCMLYISGDLATAVFWLTEHSDVHAFNDLNIGYFVEKLSAYHGDKVGFDNKKAVQCLREWRLDLIKNRTKYDKELMKQLTEAAEGCSSVNEWAENVNSFTFRKFIAELDGDYWGWIYQIGDSIPWRTHGYLVGLKMASEQLKAKEAEGKCLRSPLLRSDYGQPV